MKLLLGTFAFLLVVASFALANYDFCSDVERSKYLPVQVPVLCCTTYTSKKLPLAFLVGYEYASTTCARSAVIFKTKKNIKVCANPAEDWVKDLIKHLPPPKWPFPPISSSF